MSVRPYRSYTTVRRRGKTFAKASFFHTRGAWRARNFYKRTFRRRTEQEEEDDDDETPQICDEVGADDDDEEVVDEVEKKEEEDSEDKESTGKKEDGDNNEVDEKLKEEEPKVEELVDEKEENNSKDDKDEKDDEEKDKENGNEEKQPSEEKEATVKEDIDDIVMSGEWEVMDETDEEDDEPSRKRSRSTRSSSLTLAVEIAVPEIADKLKEVTDPLVGLEYIVEIKNEQDVTYYSCLLCKRPGRIAALLRHLNYIEHKMRYMERHLGECASLFPRGNPTTFKHEYLVAMEKLCALLGESNERRETLLVTTKEFYMQKMRALAFRAEQLPHMTFKEDAWKKVFEDLGLPTTKPSSRRSRRSRSRDRDRRSRSRDRSRRSRSRERYRDPYQDSYHDRGDSYSYGHRGRYRGRYGNFVPYHQQYRYDNYYGNNWGDDRGGYNSRGGYTRGGYNSRGGYGSRDNFYYYDDRSWNDYRPQGYYHHRDQDTRYVDYEHRGRSSHKRYEEKDSRSSHSHHEGSTVESSHSTGVRASGAIYATTKKRPAIEKPPAAKKEVVKKTSAADVKKLWDKLTKPDEHKKKEEEAAKSFWDQWLDVHDEEDTNEVTVIDQVSSNAGGTKGANSDLNSVAEMLDKNLTQIMNNYDPTSGPMFPAQNSGGTGAAPSEKVILAQKIAKALTTMGMGKIPQETLVLILQQLGLLPGGHGHAQQNSRAMDNLRRTIVKFDSVSRNVPK